MVNMLISPSKFVNFPLNHTAPKSKDNERGFLRKWPNFMLIFQSHGKCSIDLQNNNGLFISISPGYKSAV